MPDALALHMGIKPKHSRWRRRWRVAQIDAVTVGIAAKAELETRNLPLREGFPAYVPWRTPRAIVSGPAQKVDGKPPSRAREATTEFSAASASKRSER